MQVRRPTDQLRGLRTRGGWRLIARVVARRRIGVALGVVSGLIWSLGKVAVPALVRQAIDLGIVRGSAGAAWGWAALIAAVGVVAAVFTGLRRYLAFREGRRTEANLRLRVFAHIQRLHFAYHDRVQTGEYVKVGEPLVYGPLVPHDILRVRGIEVV